MSEFRHRHTSSGDAAIMNAKGSYGAYASILWKAYVLRPQGSNSAIGKDSIAKTSSRASKLNGWAPWKLMAGPI